MKKILSAFLLLLILLTALPTGIGGLNVPARSVAMQKQITITFQSKIDYKDTRIDTAYSDEFFEKPAIIYNAGLAELSAILSAAAYNADKDKGYKLYIEDAIEKQLEFPPEQCKYYNYSETTQKSDVCGMAIGYKDIKVNGNSKRLVIIVIRGTTVGEWYNCFEISKPNEREYNDRTHLGFSLAERSVYNDYINFMQGNGLDKDTELNIVWITGHSRGAAAANLLAANLTKNKKYASEESIYAYTFATPNVSMDVSSYNNIFNFCNKDDFVTSMPISQWGYGKNGHTIELTRYNEKLQNNGSAVFDEMRKIFYNDYGKSYNDFKNPGDTAKLIENIFINAPTVKEYYTKKSDNKTMNDVFMELATNLVEDKGFVGNILAYLDWYRSNSMYSSIIYYFIVNEGLRKEVAYSHSTDTYISWVKAYNNFFGRTQ